MAINKKKTSPAMKVGIILVAVLLVAAFALPLMSPNLFNGSSSNEETSTGQLEAIAASHTGAVSAYTQELASDPTSYTLLVNLGNTYSDWASEILQVQQGAGGADQPIWVATTATYERALEAQPGDPSVMTDLSIAYFYSGQWDRAVQTITAVTAANPDFSPAHYNAMIFYDSVGDSVSAAVSANAYLELDPQGQNGGDPATAQRVISDAQAVTTP